MQSQQAARNHATFRASESHGRIDDLDRRLKRIAFIARLTDTLIPIPGTDVKLGLDAVVGAVPLAGDLVMAGVASIIIRDAYKLGLPRSALMRMATNTALDAVIGSVPFIGDLFDIAFRANERNLRIVESYVGRIDAPVIDISPGAQRR